MPESNWKAQGIAQSRVNFVVAVVVVQFGANYSILGDALSLLSSLATLASELYAHVRNSTKPDLGPWVGVQLAA